MNYPVAQYLAKYPAGHLSKILMKMFRRQKLGLKLTSILKDILNELEDSKASDIVSINISKKTSLADYLVFATGTSNRHINSISQSVNKKLKKLNIKNPSIEGSNDSGWVVIDSGDVIVHLFKDEIRKFYNLENMWSTEIE